MKTRQGAPALETIADSDLSTTRRRVLGSIATGATVAVAGCSATSIGSPTSLSWTGEQEDTDGLERHLLFEEDTVFTIRQLDVAPAEMVRLSPLRFSFVLHHRDGLRTDRLQLRLVAPPADGSAFDAAVYLRSPPNVWWPAVSVSQDDEGRTIITADGLGQSPLGTGPGVANVRLDVVLVPTPTHPATDVFVGLDADLSESSTVGRTQYHLTRETRFPIVTTNFGGQA